MPVPDARIRLRIDGVWTDVTDDVRKAEGIRHTRGRQNQGARVDPSSLAFLLDNPGGRYDNRNPRSPLYGKLGRNTDVELSTYAGEVVLDVPHGVQGRASTPDHASLDIIGDIDVRAELTPTAWAGSHASDAYEVMGKYNFTSNQRSWRLMVNASGSLQFAWSTTGADFIGWNSSASVPFAPGQRGAIRATLDVNNGAGGYSLRWYTAPSLAGPWTQLGNTRTATGVTSIFNSTAPLEVGDVSTIGFADVARRIHKVEVRNGIGGTVVASPDFTVQAPGATSFADSTGRTWTVAGGASITDRRVRATVEMSKSSSRWHTSGHNVVLPVQAQGIMRRLSAGAPMLASTLRRRIPSEPSCVAYWPMEDEAGATQAYSPLPGVPPLMTTGLDYGSDDTLVGSSALPQMVGGGTITMEAQIPSRPATGQWMVTYVYRMDEVPSTPTEILEFRTTGTLRKITVNLAAGGAVELHGFDATGAELVTFGVAGTQFYGTWNRLEVVANTSGGNVEYHLGWIAVDGAGYGTQQTITGTAGVVHRTATRCGAGAVGMRLGHFGIFTSSNTAIYNGADDGFQGETAGTRAVRLTSEEGVPFTLLGEASSTVQVGPQRAGQLMTLLGECEESDGGVLLESRERLALAYRTRRSMYNQTPALTLSYGQIMHPFEPVEDDQVRNDVTVQKAGGTSGRAVLEEGPLSVADVGRYEDSRTLSLFSDALPEQVAGWLLHLGTWDEARYPRVRIPLHKTSPAVIAAVTALDVGDVFRITDLPEFLPPGPYDLMVEGYEEEIKNPFEWYVTLVCSPAGPWTVGVIGHQVLGRPDTEGTVLNGAMTTASTVANVLTTSGPRWIDSGTYASMFPFDVTVGGEIMRVTSCTGTALSQTFAVTRGINGIVKAHASGTPVALAYPMRAAL